MIKKIVQKFVQNHLNLVYIDNHLIKKKYNEMTKKFVQNHLNLVYIGKHLIKNDTMICSKLLELCLHLYNLKQLTAHMNKG